MSEIMGLSPPPASLVFPFGLIPHPDRLSPLPTLTYCRGPRNPRAAPTRPPRRKPGPPRHPVFDQADHLPSMPLT